MDDALDVIIRRSELARSGTPDSKIRGAIRRGALARVTAGVYAESVAWQALEPMEQHRERVLATSQRLTTEPVFSHFAAAALWRIRLLGPWPDLVDVTLERTSGGRSDGRLRRHCTGLEATDVTFDGTLSVTTAAQTVVDLARVLPFTDAVVAMDSALHRRRAPAPLTTKDDIFRVVANLEGRPGFHKALAAANFATHLSDSPKESESRVLIHRLGFPRPELQRVFELPNGRRAETDFYWPEFQHIGECDGRAKYVDPAILGSRSTEQAFFEEKDRENELRRLVRGFSRWEPRDLTPQRLYDRLTRDGLPSSGRRPASASFG